MKMDLKKCATLALKQCLALGKQEQLLIVCDEPCIEVGRAFFESGIKLCRETVMMQIVPRKQNGNEPPEHIADVLGRFDVAVIPTSKSLSHTQARRSACEKGTRIATLPGITTEVFLRTMNTDWEKLGLYSRKVAGKISTAKKICVKTRLGTDISFQTGGRKAVADDGRIIFKGSFGNLPAGEAYMAPLENTAEGTIVIDGSFASCGLLEKPLTFMVRKGKVAEILPHPAAESIRRLFDKYGTLSRNIAEFGVGTLDSAIISGNTLEDEKVRGTIHFAVGDNASMGGAVHVPLHLDGIIKNPDVWLDGEEFMKSGELA
jgi:leucyl aminopeptidase (aminopeptidase T)